MGIYIRIATGRATCRKCGKTIEKGTIDIYYQAGSGFRTESGHYHKKCIDKEIKQIRGGK